MLQRLKAHYGSALSEVDADMGLADWARQRMLDLLRVLQPEDASARAYKHRSAASRAAAKNLVGGGAKSS